MIFLGLLVMWGGKSHYLSAFKPLKDPLLTEKNSYGMLATAVKVWKTATFKIDIFKSKVPPS